MKKKVNLTAKKSLDETEMKIVCDSCGKNLANGQIICAGRLCVECYDKLKKNS